MKSVESRPGFLLLLLLVGVDALSSSGISFRLFKEPRAAAAWGCARREAAVAALAAGAMVAATTAFPTPAAAIGDVDRWQSFDSKSCVKRGVLGRCDVYGETENIDERQPIISDKQREMLETLTKEQDSNAYIASLRKKTEENRERNEREVAMKSFANSQAGEFGPFSRYLPVEKLDGTFDILTYPRYEELKKQKAIVGKKYVVQTDAEIQAAKDAVAKEAAAKEAEAKEAAAREAAAREATAKAAESETEVAEAPAPSKDAQERALPATAPS